MITIQAQPLHSVSPYLYMQFMEPLGTTDSSVDVAWDFQNERWKSTFVEAVKELAPPMMRWGGCFASYYHWKEAVGPQKTRIPMLNQCWEGLYNNQVGTAEFVQLCQIAGSEPLMCVNFESDGREGWAHPAPGIDRLGTAEEAAEWVAYCNDPENALRRSHGYREPLTIRYWQIGNETSYGAHGYRYVSPEGPQVAHDGFDCAAAVKATRRFARAMRDVDSSLKLIAWGDDGWAKAMCEECGDLVDMVAFHPHQFWTARNSPAYFSECYYRSNPEEAWRLLMNAHEGWEKKLAAHAEEIRPYGKRLAVTESHFVADDGRIRGPVLATWAVGIAYARIMNDYVRYSDILDIATCADFCGNRWMNNAMMFPTPLFAEKPYLLPVGSVMGLFSKHHGNSMASCQCTESAADVTATCREGKVFLHIANTDPCHPLELPLQVPGHRILKATAWEIAQAPWTEVNSHCPDIFKPVQRQIEPESYRLPPAAVAALELDIE